MLHPELIELGVDGKKAVLTLIPNTHGPLTEKDIVELLHFPTLAPYFHSKRR